MFDLNEFLKSDASVDHVETVIGGKTFLIRRFDGYERLEFTDLAKSSERVVYTIGHCLLDGKTKKPIGLTNARLFVERADALAGELARQIFKLTSESVKAEEEQWGLSEKNLQEISTSDSTGNIADATD